MTWQSAAVAIALTAGIVAAADTARAGVSYGEPRAGGKR